jgi:Zn-dependent protease with chaperone function
VDAIFQRPESLRRGIRDEAGVLDLDRVPETYVRRTPTVNATTIGVNEPTIVLTTGLDDLMEPEELRWVIGHELGHAMSGHSLYQTIAMSLIVVGGMVSSVPLHGIGLQAVQAALGQWSRKAEWQPDDQG